jgi:hypothetical protein
MTPEWALSGRNAVEPDGTGYEASFSGEAGLYTGIDIPPYPTLEETPPPSPSTPPPSPSRLEIGRGALMGRYGCTVLHMFRC